MGNWNLNRELYPIFYDTPYGERICKRMDMCMCITQSICCNSRNYHNIVNQLYFNKTLNNEGKKNDPSFNVPTPPRIHTLNCSDNYAHLIFAIQVLYVLQRLNHIFLNDFTKHSSLWCSRSTLTVIIQGLESIRSFLFQLYKHFSGLKGF